ncbi:MULTISPECIES: outer membrane protein assembly factor BamB family protein [unclassified Micromonospora]|uniref:outer membrane protein assembly factor BamB family protein n=1 Tax=unclassified Micromonospora TaxID=2617518 RepID=UPI002FF0786B
MALIDLGDVREEPVPARRPPRGVGRPARVAVALVLTLVSLAGAAPARPPTSFTVPARPSTTALLQDDRLFLVEPADGPAGQGGQLSAYAVPASGRGELAPLWRVPLPVPGSAGALVVHRDVVLVNGGVSEDGPRSAFAFDVGTGRLRWQRPGERVLPAGDALLTVESGGAEPGRVSSVDPGTGRVGWSVPTPVEATTYRYRPDGVDRIVVSPASGQVEVRDARSGARLRSGNLRPGELPVYHRSQPVDDLLLVVRDQAALVTAYGLDALERRWEIRLGLVAYFSTCGPLLCAYGQTGGMWALDRASGEVRWRATRWHGNGTERGGRMPVTGPGTGSQDALAILDTATGEVVADLGDWDLAGGHPSEGRLIGARRDGDDRLTVAEVDVASGRTRTLDVLADVSGDCQTGARLLVCRRVGGSYGIWRLDR